MLDMLTYSKIVSIGCLVLLLSSLILIITYFSNSKFKAKVQNIKYEYLIQSIFGITLLSIAGALIYQEIYETPVCPLCWQQRMLIYALLIISAVSVLIKDKLAHYYLAIISFFGLTIASQHYYYHYLKYVKGDLISLPCDATGVACSDSAIGVIFGFVTIPFMSICVFVPIIILSFLAYKNENK